MHILTRTFIYLLFFSLSYAAHADEGKVQPIGLAMHGQSKYTNQDTHIAYANPDAPKGGALKISEVGSFDTLNPYSIKGSAPTNMNLIYDRLMRRMWDEPFTMYPLIAERVEMPDDRSEVTFYINEKARFHDGSPITAEDVLFSYETLRDYGRPNMQRIYKLAQSVEIIDPLTIHFKFAEGYDRETVMIFAMMPVLSKTWWEGRDFSASVTDIPLANGPYKIEEYQIGKSITYERVEDYWARDLFSSKGHFNFDEVQYDYFRDDTIALQAFHKGDLNVRREWDSSKWFSAYNHLPKSIKKEEIKHDRPAPTHGFIINTRREIFKDQRVRSALILAFDSSWAAKNIYHGKYKQVNSLFSNSILSAASGLTDEEKALLSSWEVPSQSAQSLAQDNARMQLRAASELLKDAGWIVEGNARINAQTKEPLSFELVVLKPQEEKVALAYQRNLKRFGIDMSIRLLDTATFQQRLNIYDYDLIATQWRNSLSPGTEQYIEWSCEAADQEGRLNYSGLCMPALDHFASAIADAQDYNDLSQHAHIIDHIVMNSDIMIPLFYNDHDYVAHSIDIQRPEQTALYGIVLETWWQETSAH